MPSSRSSFAGGILANTPCWNFSHSRGTEMNSVGRARCRSCRKVSSDSAKNTCVPPSTSDEASTHERSIAVRQRQVRQHAALVALAEALPHVADDAFGRARDGAETDHHALGLAGGARGVDQHRQVVGGALRPAGKRRGARDDGVPGLEVGGRRQRQRDAGQAGRHARLLLRPGVELADEQQARLAVLAARSARCRRSRWGRSPPWCSRPSRWPARP